MPDLYIGSDSRIVSLHVADNKLHGTIPSSLVLSTKLEQLDLSFNSLIGTIPQQLVLAINSDHYYIQSLQLLSLNNNHLSGEIAPLFPSNASALYENLAMLLLSSNRFRYSMKQLLA